MAQKLDFNILLIAGAAVAALYFWKEIKGQKENIIVAKTDLAEAKGDIIETRQKEKTERVEIRQENRTERLKTIINNVFNNNKDGAVSKTKDLPAAPVPSYANGLLKFSGSSQGYSVAPEKAKTLLLQKTALETAKYSNLKPTPYNIKGVSVY